MRCPHCHQADWRLRRFDGSRDIWGCPHCNAESAMLDCHLCERRGVIRQGTGPTGGEIWACHRCQVPQYRCLGCGLRWLQPGEGGQWHCEGCGGHWPALAVRADQPQ